MVYWEAQVALGKGPQQLVMMAFQGRIISSIINQALLTYHIRLIKCTVRVEVRKIFCRRGVVKHPYNRTPQWLPIGRNNPHMKRSLIGQ